MSHAEDKRRGRLSDAKGRPVAKLKAGQAIDVVTALPDEVLTCQPPRGVSAKNAARILAKEYGGGKA
jgi:hypothetical protein